jgi:hypothetical protein
VNAIDRHERIQGAMLLPCPIIPLQRVIQSEWLRSSLATRRVNGLAIFYKSVAVLQIRLQ